MKKKNQIIGLIVGILFSSIVLTSTALSIPTLQYSLFDSTQPQPQKVGFVVSVSTEFDVSSLVNPSVLSLPRHVLTLLLIPKVPEPPTGPDWWRIGLVVHPDQIPLRGGLFFTSADCSGTPWIGEFQVNGEFDPAFDPHVVIGDSLNPDVRKLYVADPATPLSAPMDFNSVISFVSLGNCGPVVRNMQAKPAILVDADLHQTYTPTYSLNFDFADTIFACKSADPQLLGLLYFVGPTAPTCNPGDEVISWNQTVP